MCVRFQTLRAWALINFDERFLTGAPQKKTHTKTKRGIFQFCFSLGTTPAPPYIYLVFLGDYAPNHAA